MAYEASYQGRALGVDLCICDSCGMCLQHNVVIQDVNKKFFVVGMDCAMKTGDVKIMTKVKFLERERQKKIRKEKAEIVRQERAAAQTAKLTAERLKNGGLTDQEVTAAERAKKIEDVKAENSKKHAWILTVLDNQYKSGFIQSVIDGIELRGLSALSEKMKNIVADIYAKSAGRYGSKKYIVAELEFNKNFEEGLK